MAMLDDIDAIIEVQERISRFWPHSKGWAPPKAAKLLANARLDRQVSLSRMLKTWATSIPNEDIEGMLILAWVNLGTLVEGTMMWFLCVYHKDYANDIIKLSSGRELEPKEIRFVRIISYFEEHVWVDSEKGKWRSWCNHVRKRRNAIHAFQDSDLGTYEEFETAVATYRDFILELNDRVPYP